MSTVQVPLSAAYYARLARPDWGELRSAAYRRAQWACEHCTRTLAALKVLGFRLECHHKHYATFGRESIDDLEVLCSECHLHADRERRLGHSAPTVAITHLPSSAEKVFLLLMLSGELWKRRVMESLDPDEIEFAPYRAVFEALADDAPERLDETAARAWEALQAEGLGEHSADVMYERAMNWLEARRLEREIERIDGMVPLARPEDQPGLLAERRRVFDALRVRYPRYKLAAHRVDP